jgi:hypothetical protein
MTFRHYLLGFDKTSGALRGEWQIPADCEPAVADILEAGTQLLAAADPSELTSQQAQGIAALVGQRIDEQALDYFIQTFNEAPAVAMRHDAAAA